MLALRHAQLRCAFQAWRSVHTTFEDIFFCPWLGHLRQVIAFLSGRLSYAGKQLRCSCRRDKRAQLERLADRLEAAPTGEVHVELKRLLRPRKFRRKGPAPLPRLKRADGTLCTSQAEIELTWRDHFAALEGGAPVSLDEFVVQGLAEQAVSDPVEYMDSALLPDLVALAGTFRAVNPQKACGPDWIPPAVCRRFSCQMATMFYPVLLKTLAYMTEPLAMKGGTLFRIPKPNSPDLSSCASQRAILVQSVLEKVLHKAVRFLLGSSLSVISVYKTWRTYAM